MAQVCLSTPTGVSECIIMGIPMTLGTGMFKLLYRYGATKKIYTMSELVCVCVCLGSVQAQESSGGQ